MNPINSQDERSSSIKQTRNRQNKLNIGLTAMRIRTMGIRTIIIMRVLITKLKMRTKTLNICV